MKLIPIFLLLAGCGVSHVATQPPIVQHVYCVTPKQFQALTKAEPAKVGNTLTGNAQQDVKIEGSSNILLRQFADGLLQVIGGCMGN